MRRGVLLAGVWALGVAIAVTLAFAAVARVASGVAPRDVAHLSQTDIDDELTGSKGPSGHTSSVPPSTITTTTTSGSTRTTASSTTPPTTTHVTPTTSSSVFTGPPNTASPTTSQPINFGTTTTVVRPPPVTPHNTVTSAQGGTLYTRCAASDKIAYVAAVPKAGYERTVDDQNPDGIRQTFVNGHHRSDIEAECSNGVVHAHVEEETDDE